MMKLHITNCRVDETSVRATAVTEFVQRHTNNEEIANYLASSFSDDFFEVEDLKGWTTVLERLDTILVEVGAKINTCNTLVLDSIDLKAKDIACSVLKFLSLLLKASSDKRYFLTVESVRHLLRSTDIDVAVLASEVLFNLCVPSNSIINSLNDDFYDLVEIPGTVANEALVVFESLSLMSTEFGITDYLHGHQPTFVNVNQRTASAAVMELNVRFPPRSFGQNALELDLAAWDASESEQARNTYLRDLQNLHGLTADEVWTVLNTKNALYGLSADTTYRLKVVRMRLFCFFMLVHSKIPPISVQEYMKAGSRFLQDLVDLSDICSEASGELNLARPVSVAYVALENVLGLLENKLRRRSSFVVNSNILSALGLSSGAFGGSVVTGRSEGAWTNIVISACSIAPLLFGSHAGATVSSSPGALPTALNFSSSPSSASRLAPVVSDQEISSTAKFVRIGLELFALSMTTRETANVVADTPIISTIIGVVQSALPHVERILAHRHSQGTSFVASTYDTHVLLVTSKALYCLELTVERPEYFAAFRESDGIAVLSKVVEVFASVSSDPEGCLTFLDAPARNVLEGALSSLYLCIQKSRHTVILQGNTSDTGMRVVSEAYFGNLCCKLLRSPYHSNELLWAQLLTVIKEAIELDPSYLSTFLQSKYAAVFMKLIQIPFSAPFPAELFAPKPSTDLESLLVPICRLASAVAITAEGRAFISQSRMIHFVLEAIVQPCSSLPLGREVEGARLIKIGKVFGGLMQEHEELKVSIKEQLKKRLIAFAKDAQDSVRPLDRSDAADLSSTRIQALQKLADLCIIVENTFTERRSRPDDVVRDILTQPTLEALLLAYTATLPPPNQLLAQLSLRHVATTPHYGHSASAKAITSLLKIACAQITHSGVMITLLSREIDQQLNTLDAVVQLLPTLTSSAELIDVQVACSVFGKGESFKGGTVKKVPHKATSVQLVGVLDLFPQRCTMDPAFAQSLFDNRTDGVDCTYKFFTTVMTVEWLSMLMAQAIRADQRNQHSKQIDSVKETLKSMFAFHKSSLMELCRISSERWSAKPFNDSRFKKTFADALCRCDSSEDTQFIPRMPSQYQLRVAGSGGALVREGIEIEGTRVILTADVGSSLVGFERRFNEAGVLRYRTMHGWISEFRRDHQRSPIVELMSLSLLSQEEIDLERIRREEPVTETVQQERLAVEAVTIREAAYFTLTKANGAMRQVAGYLARAMFNPENVGLSRGNVVQSPSIIAPSLSLTLSKIIKGFVQHPRQCLPETCVPEGLQALSKPTSSEDLNLLGDLEPVEGDFLSSFDRLTLSGSLKATPSSAQKNKKGKSKSTDEDESCVAEAVEISVGAACLYYGMAVKQIVVPMLEDKNGNLNVLLLRSLCNQGAVAALVEAFALTVLVLKKEIDAAEGKEEISSTGRCAYFALPNLLAVMQRLVSRDLLNKSIAAGAPGGVPTTPLADEIGAYQAHELVFQLLSTVHKHMLPLLQSGAMTRFPAEVQSDWLGVVSEFVRNLSTALPPPMTSRTSYSAASGRGTSGNPDNLTPAQLAGMFGLHGLGAHSPSSRPEIRPERRTPSSALPRAAPTNSEQVATDPETVRALTEMGFANEHIHHTLSTLRTTNVDMLLQYMFNHPWTPPPVPIIAGIAVPAAESNADASPVPTAAPVSEAQDLPTVPTESSPTVSPQPPVQPVVSIETPQQSNYLPNLVPDLDEADGGSSPVVDLSADSSTPQAPSAAAQQEAPSPAMRQLAGERFRSDMSLLFDHALPRGLTTPMTGADEQLGRTSSNNRPSSQRSPFGLQGATEPNPNGMGSAIRDKEREAGSREAHANYRDFNSQSQRVSAYAKQIGGLFVPTLLDICSQYDQIGRWSAKESHTLIAYMVELLLKLNAAETPVKYVLLSSIYDDVVALVTVEVSRMDQSALKLQGLLYFLLNFLGDISVRKQLVEGSKLTREKCTNLVALVSGALNKVMADAAQHWPKWVSPAMLLFCEFLSLPNTVQGGVTRPHNDNAGESAWDSKDEKGDLAESKSSVEDHEQRPALGFDASVLLLNQVLLLSDSVRLEMFDVVMKLVKVALCSKSLPSDAQNSTLAVLVSLLSSQKFVTRFVAGDGVRNVLTMCSRETSLESRTAQGRVLTLIVQRCMETEIELEQSFAGHMRDLHRGTTSEDKCLPFASFIQSLTSDLLRSPDDFWQACKHTVKIIKVQTATRKGESGAESKSEIKVRLLEKEQLDEFLAQRSRYGDADNRAYVALRAVLHHVVLTAKENVTVAVDFSAEEQLSTKTRVSSALDAVADSILSLKRAPILAAKLIKTESESIGLSSGENLVDFLISRFFADTLIVATETAPVTPTKVQPNPDLVACSRVLVALCAFKGTSRIITLNAMLKSLRVHAVSASAKGALSERASDASVRSVEIKRVMMLSRLASLFGIIIRASKTSPKDGASHKGGQGVSVDTLHYLIEHGHVLKLLTLALCSIPMNIQSSSGAVSAIIDLVELITRPKIQAHLDKLTEQIAANDKNGSKTATAHDSSLHMSEGDVDVQNSSAEHGADELFMFGGDDHTFGRSTASQSSHSPAAAMLEQAGFRPFGHNLHSDGEDEEHVAEEEDEDDEGSSSSNSEDDDEEEEDGDEEDDEDYDEEDDEEEDSSSEDDDDEEGDDEDDEEQLAEDMLFGNEGDEMEEDEEEEADTLEAHMRQLEQDASFDFGQIDDAYVNVESVLHSRDERQSIIDQLENAVFAREMDDPGMRNTTFITPPMRGNADFQFVMSGLNISDPNLDIADIMRRLTSGQEIRGVHGFPNRGAAQNGASSGAEHGAGMAELLPQGVAAALEVTPAFSSHQLFGADPLASLLNQPGGRSGAYPSAPLGRRNAYDGRTDPRVLSRAPQQSPWLDVGEFGEFDPAMAAMWPRGATGVPLRTASQQRAPAAAPGIPLVNHSMAELALQQLQDSLIEGLDVVEESANDEVSQGSFTESRGDGGDGGLTEGGFSLTSSNIALQDPNPRRGGDDSRQGDPIPPIIEIDTPDHEGNEELSVITLPQDEANAASTDHEESTSVNFALQEMQRLLSQHSRSSVSPPRSPLLVAHSGSMPTSPVTATHTAASVSPARVVAPVPEPVPTVDQTITSLSFDALLLSLAMPPAPPVAVNVALPPPAPVPDVVPDATLAASPANREPSTRRASGGSDSVPDLVSDSSDSSDDEPTARRERRTRDSAILSSSASSSSAEDVAQNSSTEATSESALTAAAADTSSPTLVDLTGTASTQDEEEEDAASDGRLACPAGYDSEVFYSLPEDMQLEIIEQHGETVDQTRALIEAAGLDYDAIASLPESIRQEVLEQARRDQAEASGASTGGSGGGGSTQEMDNANFLASLTLELRTEVLITADAEFLNTLPPELIAEAQSLREQAASNWQRRELMSRASARENAANSAAAAEAARLAALGGMGVGAGGQFYGEEDDEDEDDEDGLDELQMSRGAGLQFGTAGRPHRAKSDRPRTGLMRVPGSQSWNMKIPRHLVVAIAKMILQAPKQPSRSTAAFRILQNVSGALRSKDLHVRLLIGLIANNKELTTSSLQQLCGAEADTSMLQDGPISAIASDTISKPTLSNTRKIASDSDVDVSAHSTQRIIAVLSQLVAGNNAFVYLLLSERDASFAISDKDIAAKLEAVRPTHSDKEKAQSESTAVNADGSVEAVSKANEVTDGLSSPSRVVRGPRSGDSSTNSLLERIVCLFAKPNVTGSAAELDSVANLLSVVTGPLEYLEDETTAQAVLPVGVVTPEMQARDVKHHMVTLPVPRVVLSKESLRFLCDVLLNDHCSKRVLLNVTSTISRLSKVYSNHTQLLELIVDVIGDLADQSQYKLEVFATSLQQIHHKYIQTQKEKGPEKAASSIGTPNKGRPASLKVSGEETGSSSPVRASLSSSAIAVKSALPTSLLPLGESGGKQHERLLRVVQTLYSMAVKTNRQLSDVTPSDELSDLWKGLEQVLQQLRHYLVDVDEAEAGDQDGTESTRPQSALTSILNRLLPAIEAFFLVHATDLLVDKPRSVEKSAAVPVEVTAAPAVAAVPSATSSDALGGVPLSPPPNTSELIPLSSMPGHCYRTSAAYLRNNLSLFATEASGSLDEAACLQSTRSLRRQPSLNSVNSRNYSVLTTRGHRLMHFVQTNKGLLNLLVKAKPALLDDSFSAFVRITQLRACLKFDNKRKYFFTHLKRSNQSVSRRGVHLQIRRNQVFEDSFHQLRSRTAEELRGRLQVNFYGEEGVDAGGLSREWYVILAREIFNPNYALFTAAVDGATFQPNPLSIINTNHLEYFKFVGRLIGKAICDGQLLDAHFTRSFYKHVLGMPVDFQDIEATEPDYYKTLRQVLDTPLDLLMMDLTFSAEIQKFGHTEIVDLIPNGRNILVTDDNKADYIRLIAHHRMTSAIRSQIDSFLQGFYDLVPAELVCVFSPAELELLICGLPDVNVAELQANTEYHQYRAGDEVIVWFWDALKSLNREERASFLQFVTGTSKVPLGGFANLQGMRGTQKFSIHKAYGDAGLLPTAHTCFNQLDLPVYGSAEELKEKLLMAITEGAEGFGFA